jgi:predicted transposase/invertase (TIGR01784 family)
MRAEDGEQVSDLINMIVVELNKMEETLNTPVGEMTSLDMWSAFLGYADNPQRRGIINEMISKKEALGMASTILMSISKDDHERAKFRSRRKYETDMISNILTAEANAEERGERRGIGIMARNLKNEGVMSLEEIARISGFTLTEVEDL